MFVLRDYQQRCVDAVWHYFRTKRGNPLIVVPTGGGKSIILAGFIRAVLAQYPDTRVLVTAHVKELVEQDAEKLDAMLSPGLVGVYSAGLGRRELGRAVTVAGIQSIANRLDEVGHIDLLFIDEAHLVPKGGEGRYRKVIESLTGANPHLKVVGLSATPYRMGTGMLHQGHGRIFTHIAATVGVQDLIDRGFLSPLRSKAAITKANLANVGTRGGEFVAGQLQDAVNRDYLIEGALREMHKHASDRKSWIAFCAGVEHAEAVMKAMNQWGISALCLTGETPKVERGDIISRFKAGQIRALVNVSVLTTGFDAPGIDCIMMLRPTKSPGLYYQMLGRGMRIQDGKIDCLVMDFAGNVARHGPVDTLGTVSSGKRPSMGEGVAPQKACPECREVCPVSATLCSACGVAFDVDKKDPHAMVASSEALLSRDIKPVTRLVRRVGYKKHEKPGGVPSMRVTYFHGIGQMVSEWICFEHKGFARRKAREWWRARADTETPETVEDALSRLDELMEPMEIDTKKDGKYTRIIAVRFETLTQETGT